MKPNQWMSELNNCIDEDLSPFIKSLDHIVELLEDTDELSCFRLEKMLRLIAEKDSSFLFKIAYSGMGDLSGCVWQTGVMRGNYENFGHYISLDAMRRELNEKNWSYLAATVKNDVNESQVCIECLAIGERKDAYRFMLSELIQFSPGMSPSDVFVVSSDGFLDQLFVNEFYPNASFILDRYHLIEAVKKEVTLVKWRNYEPLFYSMINAKNDTEFDRALHEVQQLHSGNSDLTKYIPDKSETRSTFTIYKLQQLEGNLGLVGSAISEQNNSSVLSFINDLTESRSIEDLVTLLLRRQNQKELKSNQRLRTQSLILKNEQRAATLHWEREAASKLCLISFQKFMSEAKKADEYGVTQNGNTFMVRRIGSDAPPRLFSTENDRCNCPYRIANIMTCGHEVAISKFLSKPIFCQTRFHKRHFLRDGLYVSYYTTVNAGNGDLNDVDDVDDESFHGGNNEDDDVNTLLTNQEVDTLQSLSVTQSRKVTYNDLKVLAIEMANECLKWKNDSVSKLVLGLLSKTVDVLKNPGAADPSWVGSEVALYAESFLTSCKESFTKKPFTLNKRKKSSIEILSQTVKPKACSLCGEYFSTGHHTKRNCSNALGVPKST